MAETAAEKRVRKQRELDAENLDANQMSKRTSYRFNPLRKIGQAITGESDFGTELSPAAEKARDDATRKKFPNLPFKSEGYTPRDEDVLRAGREAAAQERREGNRTSPGMKKGGAVKGWGKARGARAAKYY